MSKLADKIRKTLRLEAAPIGFRAVSRSRDPSLLLAVLLDSADSKRAAAAIEQGADTVVFRLSRVAEAEVAEAVKAASDRPCGLWSGALDRQTVSRLAAAGIDYVVFEAENTPASALLAEKLGYVLALTEEYGDAYLRTLEALPLDAVFLPQWEGILTVRRQAELRRVSGLTRKPLMLPIPPSIDGAELECLRDSGVSLVLIDGDEKGALDALPSLRQSIEALPAPRRRREERAEAILPRVGEAATTEGEEEEEGEEEDGL